MSEGSPASEEVTAGLNLVVPAVVPVVPVKSLEEHRFARGDSIILSRVSIHVLLLLPSNHSKK